MQRRVIDSTGLWIAVAEREMHRATYFFVEEDVFGATLNARVIAKGKLTKIACALVNIEHMLQYLLSLPCSCLSDLAFVEDQANTLYAMPIVCRRYLIGNDTISTVLDWPREKFTARKIALAIAIDEDAVRD